MKCTLCRLRIFHKIPQIGHSPVSPVQTEQHRLVFTDIIQKQRIHRTRLYCKLFQFCFLSRIHIKRIFDFQFFDQRFLSFIGSLITSYSSHNIGFQFFKRLQSPCIQQFNNMPSIRAQNRFGHISFILQSISSIFILLYNASGRYPRKLSSPLSGIFIFRFLFSQFGKICALNYLLIYFSYLLFFFFFHFI